MARTYSKPPPLVDVLREYIDEAAFLYNARRQCLVDPELSWESLGAREQRLDWNLEGLVLGGMHSARLLKDKLTLDEKGDPGEAFAAAAVYPSLGRVEPMQWLTAALAGGGPHYEALVDGLLYNEDKGLDPWVDDYLANESPLVRAAGTEILARREPAGFAARLDSLLDDHEPAVFLAAASALPANSGRSQKRLTQLLQHPHVSIVNHSARLLLRAGHRETLPALRERIKASNADLNHQLVMLLGACGEIQDGRLITEISTAQPEVLPECIAALGLSGSASASAFLISQLSDPAQKRVYLAAVDALRTISGKEWFPTFDTDEAEAGDIVRFQQLWRDWHFETGAKLAPDTKYRLGLPLSPAVLVADLRRKGNPNRDLSFLELRFRYGCPVDFQHDARYSIQSTQLKKIEDWSASSGSTNRT